jgi:uncharacterized protein YgiB involved in biofilm formation
VKKTSHLTLLLVPLLLTACGQEPDMQRDVYLSKEDCVADWNEAALCGELSKEDKAAYVGGGGHGAVATTHPYYFWGPSYYNGNRAVEFAGKTIQPTTMKAVGAPFAVRATSSSTAKASPGVASRGGFGGAGRAVAFGGHGSSGG